MKVVLDLDAITLLLLTIAAAIETLEPVMLLEGGKGEDCSPHLYINCLIDASLIAWYSQRLLKKLERAKFRVVIG